MTSMSSRPLKASGTNKFPGGSAGSTTEAEARRATPEQKGMLVDGEGYRGGFLKSNELDFQTPIQTYEFFGVWPLTCMLK